MANCVTDHYRRFVVYLRLFFGVATCLLSLLDINYKHSLLTVDENSVSFEFSGSAIMILVAHSLPRVPPNILALLLTNHMYYRIPLFAIILACDQVIELVRDTVFLSAQIETNSICFLDLHLHHEQKSKEQRNSRSDGQI